MPPEASETEPPFLPATPSDLAIATQGLTKRFHQRSAVDSLTMSIPRGTIAGFVGPNGAGKTTTIRLLLGLIRPTVGRATVLGRDITHPLAYLPRVGALIEAPAFYRGLSGRKNLEVLACLGGYPAERIGAVLDVVSLGDRANDRVGQYSLGMKQRLGIAMALLPDPELLILDEPANGLDPVGIIEIRDLLRRLRDEGKTIFLSSHLLGELERVADWLVILNHGQAVFHGPARDFFGNQSELIVATESTAQLEVVAQIASAAGYTARINAGVAHIACPQTYAGELSRSAAAAGVTLTEIRYSQGSLEEQFLALLKGAH